MKTQHPATATGVLIVDDHEGYRSVAAEVVNATHGFVVAGSATCRTQALDVLRQNEHTVDLILMDVHLGDDDGVSLTREITTSADVAVVLVTTLALEDLPKTARNCGARGYLPKAQLSPTTLAEVNHGVYDWPRDDPARGTGR